MGAVVEIMDKIREKHVAEMRRLQNAINKTKSEHLKRDYSKALVRMRNELLEYDRYMRISK